MRTIKQMKIKVGFFLFALMLCNQGVAKEIQIGSYDSLAVMNDSVIWSDAKRTVHTFQMMSEHTLSEMEKTLSAEEEMYTASKDSMTEKERIDFETKLNEKKEILEFKKNGFYQDMEILHEKLYGPIISSVRSAIKSLISKHNLSALVAAERLSDTQKSNALNLTQELIAEVIRLEKMRKSVK